MPKHRPHGHAHTASESEGARAQSEGQQATPELLPAALRSQGTGSTSGAFQHAQVFKRNEN